MNEKVLQKSAIDFLIEVEKYQTPYAKSVVDPEEIVISLIRKYSLKAGLLSFTANILPSPISELAIIPEVYGLLRLQSRMIKDIAALYGKEKSLAKNIIFYCLFNREKTNLWERSLKMVGTRVLIRGGSKHYLYDFLEEWETGLSQKIASLKIKKIMPLVGSAAGGTIAYLDTRAVGLTASRIFSREIQFEQ
ncbi:MAG: hypothetical protein KDK36_21075 [Leptospiraceae bacterium]|nr:hypothetical protein [Leptospiraceae bacterium]